MEHGERCPVCKRYWNKRTQKWLMKPVRESRKGMAIGMAVGDTYRKNLEAIKADHPVRWKSYAYLPVNITLSQIEADAAIFWTDTNVRFQIDRALALSTLLINKTIRKVTTPDNSRLHSLGYVGMPARDLVQWVGSGYKAYIEFFKAALYIHCYSGTNGETEFYFVGKHSKYYMFHPRHTVRAGDVRKYYRVEYSTPNMLAHAFQLKEERRQDQLSKKVRQQLVQNMYKLAASFNVNGFTEWCLENRTKFRSDKSFQKHLFAGERLDEGDIYITPKDYKGERFHSILTNHKKEIRYFFKDDMREVDVKNSQFYFFACMVKYPEQTMKLLTRGMDSKKLRKVHDHLREFYNKYQDVEEFVEGAISGKLYDILISKYGSGYKKKKVKDICFRTLFSTRGQCQQSKKILQRHYPNLIQACEIINTAASKYNEAGTAENKIYSIPYLLQRVEARVLIDKVAVAAAERGAGAFTTVHDSFLCSAADVPLFEAILESTFESLGLPLPQMQIEKRTMDVVSRRRKRQPTPATRNCKLSTSTTKTITLSDIFLNTSKPTTPEVPVHIIDKLRKLDEKFKEIDARKHL